MIKFKNIILVVTIVILFSFIAWLSLLYHMSKHDYLQEGDLLSTENSLIVVLTGGKGRIEKGMELLRKGNGKFLLISGVFKKEKVKNKYLFEDNLDLKECCIFFEEKAKNTFQNASEVSNWLKDKKVNIESIQLITSYYHIPRSFIIFKKFFPDKKIITVPVSQFSLSKELLFHIKLIFSEYLKIFYTFFYLL